MTLNKTPLGECDKAALDQLSNNNPKMSLIHSSQE